MVVNIIKHDQLNEILIIKREIYRRWNISDTYGFNMTSLTIYSI